MKNKGDTFSMDYHKPRKSVDIKKADNGFVVSSWYEGKEKVYIAKNQKEATMYANKCLKI